MKEKDRLSALRQTYNAASGVYTDSSKIKKKKKQINLNNGWYGKKLGQAGLDIPPRIYIAVVLVISTTASTLTWFLGAPLAIFIFFILSYFLLFGLLDDRANKRKKKVVPQLAPFIDGLASALSTGFNLEGAVAQAAEGLPDGVLKTELDKVVRAIGNGFTITEASNLLKERISGKEVTSLCVSLSLFSSMGGYVLEPFRRLAIKIREQQTVVDKANRDLVMVKQAFFMIFILAVSAPGVLMIVKPQYMKDAFADSLGRLLLQGGVMLILLAILIFRRITNLRI